jgi:hypothetical protein
MVKVRARVIPYRVMNAPAIIGPTAEPKTPKVWVRPVTDETSSLSTDSCGIITKKLQKGEARKPKLNIYAAAT